MANRDEKTVVVVRRGCTCCGTGCVVVGLVIPAATLLLWSTAGALVAIAAVTAAILARGTQVALRRRRAPARALDPPPDCHPGGTTTNTE